jgi:hypothetical protein
LLPPLQQFFTLKTPSNRNGLSRIYFYGAHDAISFLNLLYFFLLWQSICRRRLRWLAFPYSIVSVWKNFSHQRWDDCWDEMKWNEGNIVKRVRMRKEEFDLPSLVIVDGFSSLFFCFLRFGLWKFLLYFTKWWSKEM